VIFLRFSVAAHILRVNGAEITRGRPKPGQPACKIFIIFTRESSYSFQHVLAIAILSVCPSVCPSVTRVDQSKTMQARITKSLPLAAWKTLVLRTVKLFHKFEGGHPERGR